MDTSLYRSLLRYYRSVAHTICETYLALLDGEEACKRYVAKNMAIRVNACLSAMGADERDFQALECLFSRVAENYINTIKRTSLSSSASLP